MTPIQQAQEVIDKYQWSLYSVPYCVEVMSGLLKHIKLLVAGNELLVSAIDYSDKRIHDLEDQLELTRAASNVEPM
jgi:hypothetical protein